MGVFPLTQAWVCSLGVPVWIHLLRCLPLVLRLLTTFVFFAWHWVQILTTRICRKPSSFRKEPQVKQSNWFSCVTWLSKISR